MTPLVSCSFGGGGSGSGGEVDMENEEFSQTVFGNLTFTTSNPVIVDSEIVTLNGVVQNKIHDIQYTVLYDVANMVVTFAVAPLVGDKIKIYYAKKL